MEEPPVVHADRTAVLANRLGTASAVLACAAAFLFFVPVAGLDTDTMRPIGGLLCYDLLPVAATIIGAVSLTMRFNQPALAGILVSLPFVACITPAIVLFGGLYGP